MVEKVKLFGVKVKACDLFITGYNVASNTNSCKCSHGNHILFTNPLGKVWFSVVFPFPISF